MDQGYFTVEGCEVEKSKGKRRRGAAGKSNVAVMAKSEQLEDLESGKKSSQCRYFKAKVLDHHKAEGINQTLRLDTPRFVNDRGIHYHSHYAIAGGNAFSSSFTRASQRAVGWSAGAHGLRHTYAQQRMAELQEHGLDRDEALLAVSQELGHFRPDITLVYLR